MLLELREGQARRLFVCLLLRNLRRHLAGQPIDPFVLPVVVIVRLQLESAIAAPAVARHHQHGPGCRRDVGRGRGSGRDFRRPHRVRVARTALGMQKSHHAGKRNGVCRLQLADGVEKGFDEILARHQFRVGRIGDVVAVGIGLRERMAFQDERGRAERPEHRARRRAFDFAIVQVDQDQIAVLDDHGTVVRAVLVGREAGSAGQNRRLAMRQLDDVLEAKGVELVAHHVDAKARDKDARLLRDAPERRIVKVIEMMV